MIKKNDVLKSRYYSGTQRKVLAVVDGMYALSNTDNHDWFTFWVSLSELERDYVIPQEEFVPEHGQVYWYISSLGEVKSSRWYGVASDRPIKDFLGIYPDRASAEQALAEIKEKIKK